MNRRPCRAAASFTGFVVRASLASALVAAVAVAHAQSIPACPWVESDPVPPARPLDARSTARLLSEAEKAYRDRRDTEAIASLRQVVGQDPSNERAWLRLGNLLQRTGRSDAALAAYARAASVDPTDEEPHRADRASRAKASLNFAMLSLQRAQRALSRIDVAGLDDATRATHADLLQRVGDIGSIDTATRTPRSARVRADGATPATSSRPPGTTSGTGLIAPVERGTGERRVSVIPVDYLEPPASGRSGTIERTTVRSSMVP